MTVPSIQVIDETKEFHEVDSFIKSNNLRNAGLDYHVVAVFGSQSTGKSTLLNALFNTQFQVMNEGNRSQTTKGIWLSQAKMANMVTSVPAVSSTGSSADEEESGSDEFVKVATSTRLSPEYESETSETHPSNILVLDVEGTDGRERGEDQDFERKSALFALATSEVLIVNMWENQVGLYQGANMGLLKTVFEVNLSVFGKNKVRSVLLFVIRDYLGTTPLENLGTTIKADLTRVWSEIAKPAELSQSRFEDFFDVQFFGLPHKVLQGEEFKKEVGKLSHLFIDSKNKDAYIFDPAYHRKVPADGWDMYARSIWDQIEQNKDLDLPTQQILVARFRCEELAGEAWNQFELLLEEKGLHTMLESSSPDPAFGTHASELRTTVIGLFDTMASRYHKTVYSEKRTDLLKKLDVKLSALFKHQLHLVSRGIFSDFKSFKFDANHGIESFTKLKNDSLMNFDKAAEHGSLGVFDYSKERNIFKEQLDEQEDIIKKQEISRIIDKCNKTISATLSKKIGKFFSEPTEVTWTQLMNFFNETVDSTIEPYIKNGFNVGAEDTESYVKEIRKTAWQNLDLRLKDVIDVDSVVSNMREHFENRFRFDENDIPIVWKPGDNIEKPFTVAREETDNILPIFATAKLETGELVKPDISLQDETEDIDSENEFAIRLTEEDQKMVAQKFKRLADAAYIDAKRSTTQMATQIPWFIFVIIAVLGWNEFIAVLRNPFLFMFAIMVLGGAYAVHALNMWGPVIRIFNALMTESVHVVRDKWNEVQDAVTVETKSAENIEMNDLEPKTTTEESEEKPRTAMPGSF